MTTVISGICASVKDKGCLPVCPMDCIYEGERQLYIHPDQCIDCGACQPACPVQAIFVIDELPPDWKHSAQEAADFFQNGLPGSAEPARP
jgi:NAD-dependent dihydropyrimidine dehydrogenase PreA subunit